MLDGMKVAVIGVGKLGEALISGLLANTDLEAGDISGSVAHESSFARVRERLGIKVTNDNKSVVRAADLVIVAVKPQNVIAALDEIASSLKPEALIISVAASVTISSAEKHLPKGTPVVRAMPNTPAIVGAGMTAISGGSHALPRHLELTERIFKCVGETVFVDEALMDGVTALSASGPAYLYVVLEALAEAGVKLGLSRETSTFLVAQTMLGSAKMALVTKAHPALLKERVTTPAGCTIDGLMELEDGKIRVTLIKAVVKAAERARELAGPQD